MNGWLILKHTLHEISIRLWLERKVEHTLIPSLDRPSHTLAQIIDGTPISQTQHLVTVHLIEVWSHRSHTRLTLIEGLFRITLHITREVHIAIVVGVYLGCHRQIGRNGIGLDVAVAGMHRHGRQSGIVITVQQLLLDFIGGNAPIIERQIAVLLQLVTQTPKDNRRMVSISLYPFRNVFLPKALPLRSAAGILGKPFVVKFIHHQDAILIAKLQEILAVWIMRRADMVHTELLDQLESLLDGTRIGSCTQGTEGMMVGIALQQDLLAIHQQALLRNDFDGAHAKLFFNLISHLSLLIIECHLGSI